MYKWLTVLFLVLTVSIGYSAQQTLNNLDTFLQIRTKTNQNFTELYGWGNHAGLYSLLNHDHTGVYSLIDHNHSGVYEPVLGNPASNGLCLVSTTTGTRSWSACGTGGSGDPTALLEADLDIADATPAIGSIVTWRDDGDGNPSLPIEATGTDDQTAAEVSVTDTGAFYVATDVEGILAEIGPQLGGASALNDLTDVVTTGAVSGSIIKFNGTNWVVGTDETAAGAGYVSTAPTYSDEACTAGQYAFTTTTGYVCVSSGDWNTFALTNWSNPTPDTTPDQFTFIDQVDVALSTEITSVGIYVEGINAAADITVTGGTYDINESGTFVSTAGTVNNMDVVRARHMSSDTAETAVNTVVTIGGVEDTFTSTTAAASATPTVVGNDTVGGATSVIYYGYVAGDIYLVRLPLDGETTLTEVSIYGQYFTNASSDGTFLVYSDDAGEPDELVATLGTTNAGASGPVWFGLTGLTQAVSGDYIWVGYQREDTQSQFYRNDTEGNVYYVRYKTGLTFGSPPATWGASDGTNDTRRPLINITVQ